MSRGRSESPWPSGSKVIARAPRGWRLVRGHNCGIHGAYVGTLAATEAFDANTCNATVQSGCGTIATLSLGDPGGGPNGLQVDPANDTLYTANFDTTVSAFDLHHCNAGDLAGCATDAPRTVSVPGPRF